MQKGDIIAVLSDEAREAQVAQARALLNQRKAELDAKRRLIEMGNMPRLDLVNLEAQFKAAEAGLAAAEAERDRGVVLAPWSGIVTDVPVEVGQAAFSFTGREIAHIIALDPIACGGRGGGTPARAASSSAIPAEVRLVTGETVAGQDPLRLANRRARMTRTYRVEIEIANPDACHPGRHHRGGHDQARARAGHPRAALGAHLLVGAATSACGPWTRRRKVAFIPVSVVEDEHAFMWVAGIADGARVIVQGQDFVREGSASRRSRPSPR